MPPSKPGLKAPPAPPPKPPHQPLSVPPLPPPKPYFLSPHATTDQHQQTNGAHSPPPALSSAENREGPGENGGAAEGELEVGSMVEVNEPPLFGVIRWVGQISGIPEAVAGIELVGP